MPILYNVHFKICFTQHGSDRDLITYRGIQGFFLFCAKTRVFSVRIVIIVFILVFIQLRTPIYNFIQSKAMLDVSSLSESFAVKYT